MRFLEFFIVATTLSLLDAWTTRVLLGMGHPEIQEMNPVPRFYLATLGEAAYLAIFMTDLAILTGHYVIVGTLARRLKVHGVVVRVAIYAILFTLGLVIVSNLRLLLLYAM